MTTETTPDLQPVFPGGKTATHMPFFDGTTLVFCQSNETVAADVPAAGNIWKKIQDDKVLAERMKNLPRSHSVNYRPWKLAYCNWKDKIVHTIDTGFPANRIERSPAIYRENNRIHLSFISGMPTSGGFVYRLYTCSGNDLAHLDQPKPVSSQPVFFGFVSPHHICWGTMNAIRVFEKATGLTFRICTNFHRVSSVNFLANNPAKLLITGLLDREHHCQTIVYDLATDSASEVSVGGPVYKSSLHEKQLIFAQKRSGFEDRELCCGDYALAPSTIRISKEK